MVNVIIALLIEFQGVVTYTSPVEAFATGIKSLDRWKSSLVAWLLHSEILDCLILQEFKDKSSPPAKYLRKCIDQLILVTQNSSWSLDWLLKRILIAWFHFYPCRERLYRRRLGDYPCKCTFWMFQCMNNKVGSRCFQAGDENQWIILEWPDRLKQPREDYFQ